MKFLRYTLPHLNLLTKILLVLIILGMLVVGGLSIRLAQGPMDLGFIKPKVEKALSEQIESHNVQIASLALSWDSFTEPLLLDLHQVRVISNSNQSQSNSIDKISIGLSAEHLLIGKILPSIVEIENPVFELIEENGELKFFWQGIENKNAPQAEKSIETPELDQKKMRKNIRAFLNDIFVEDAQSVNVLRALKRLHLKQAVIKSLNAQEQAEAYLALVDLELNKNSYGLNGQMDVRLPSGEGRDAYFKSDVIYRQDEQDVTFTAQINDINPSYLVDFFPEMTILQGQNLFIDGEVQAAFDDKLKLQNAKLNLIVPEGNIVVPDVYDEGLSLKDIILEADLNTSQKQLNVSKFNANIGGIAVSGETTAIMKDEIISAPISIEFEDFETNNLAEIFPKSQAQTSAGQWITQRISEGIIKDLKISSNFVMAPSQDIPLQNQIENDEASTAEDNNKTKEQTQKEISSKYSAKLNDVRASFTGEGLTIKYSETLMPVIDANATGVYEDDTLTINGTQGMIGDVKGTDVNLKMTNLSVKGGGMAYLTLNGKGPFRTILKYVSDEPIAMGDSFGFKAEDVKGNIDFNLDMEFPTIKDLPKEQVIVKVDGTITDLALPNIVQGLPLTGGPYKIGFSDGKINLSGKGQLGGRNIDVSWEEFVSSEGRDYESQIKASLVADEGLREAFNIGLEEYISGPIPIDIVYTDRGVPATIDMKGQLNQATLHIEPFDYRKAPGVDGALSLKAYMKNDDLQEVDNLNVKAEGLSLNNGRLIFRKLKDGSDDISRGSIPQAVIGKSNLKVDFEVTPENILKVIAAGPVFDLEPFIKSDETKASANGASDQWSNPANDNSEEQPMQISLQAQKLLADKNITLNNAKVYLETDKDSDIIRLEMDSKVGNGDLFVRFKPDRTTGQRNFRLESSDAGAALNAFGLYDKINGGNLIVYGEPKQGDQLGNIYGKAQIDNFTVSKAPVLAKLLSAMSLNGVQDVLQNNGLAFAKLESDFEWQFRSAGNLLVMKNGRTSGSSLGLTFEGVYNQEKSNVDISGTVIPLSTVNKAIGEIPVIGQILTGGKAFLAATYKISGPSADPKVSINPLSVLAPGFIRNILFEESVESKVKKAQ